MGWGWLVVRAPHTPCSPPAPPLPRTRTRPAPSPLVRVGASRARGGDERVIRPSGEAAAWAWVVGWVGGGVGGGGLGEAVRGGHRFRGRDAPTTPHTHTQPHSRTHPPTHSTHPPTHLNGCLGLAVAFQSCSLRQGSELRFLACLLGCAWGVGWVCERKRCARVPRHPSQHGNSHPRPHAYKHTHSLSTALASLSTPSSEIRGAMKN